MSVSDAKAELLEQLKYNKPLSDACVNLIDGLVAAGGEAPPPEGWWRGAFILNSCNEFNRWLRKISGPLLDGAPVTVTVEEDGALHLETDMLVVSCATGLRVFGSVTSEPSHPESASVTLAACDFFEPSEEFGITKALEKCEEKLRPKMPSAAAPKTASLELRYADDDLILAWLRADGEEDRPLVISRVLDERTMEVMRARRG